MPLPSFRKLKSSSSINPFKPLAASTFGHAVLCKYTGSSTKPCDVVVKVPKNTSISQEWLSEWIALSALPKHDNVINLIGLCENFHCITEDGKEISAPISFVSRYYPHGSIADYFADKKHEGHARKYLLPWALDIARGLAHLHAFKCVHRDLAARNIFIDENMRAGVGDLGLAKHYDDAVGVYMSEGKSAAYPADVAAEVVTDNKYSAASDTFSFGLTLFEIATECKFASFFSWNTSSASAHRVFTNLEHEAAIGYPVLVAKLPSWLSSEMKELMLQCLALDPSKRPVGDGLIKAVLKCNLAAHCSSALDLFETRIAECQQEAVDVLRALVDQGHTTSMTALGCCLANARYSKRQPEEAVALFAKAAETDLSAQFNLAVCLASGLGIEKDEKEAMKWFRKAAEGVMSKRCSTLPC